MSSAEQVPDPIQLIRDKFSDFLAANPASAISSDSDSKPVISEPWGDSTFTLRLDRSIDELAAALNALYLPPRYSAIWHRDTKDLEILFFPVKADDTIRSRAFEFRLKGRVYKCEFGNASSRLLTIASQWQPVAPADETDYRNLASFARLVRRRQANAEDDSLSSLAPTSFWIKNVEWDETEILDLVRNLNFYMSYFHRGSPRILIHRQEGDRNSKKPLLTRYPLGTFPTIIAGRGLNPYLLGLWESSVTADTSLRFLYSYQILEYAAFYFTQESVNQKLKMIIQSPNVAARTEDSVKQILDTVVESRMDDSAKFSAVLKQLVQPQCLWTEINEHLQYFSETQVFDGGFQVLPLIKTGWAAEDFCAAWHPRVSETLRAIRNALVHSREARMSKVIAPNAPNLERLRPWTALVSVAAMEVMLYED
jgi:hypothetical protein